MQTQTPRSSLSSVNTVCHSVCIFWTHYSMLKPPSSNLSHHKTKPTKWHVCPVKTQMPSLIRVFTVHMKKVWILSYPLSKQRRLWSDLADAQVDLGLRWAHSHFVFCHVAAHFTVITANVSGDRMFLDFTSTWQKPVYSPYNMEEDSKHEEGQFKVEFEEGHN